MYNINPLPEKIQQLTEGLPCKQNKTGMSGAEIYVFENLVLKVEKTSAAADQEYYVLQWLEGKLPVPKVVYFEKANGFNYLLMSKLQGEMACSETNMKSMNTTVKALAEGLKLLWSVDISDCPFINTLEKRLALAKENIKRKALPDSNIAKENGFKSPDCLYQYLSGNRPKDDDNIFSHGDYCLPNVFVFNGRCSGFLDLGTAGIADKWQDIAVCVRSHHYNYIILGGHSEKEYTYYKNMLFDELGIKPDEEKIKYYILLDKLF